MKYSEELQKIFVQAGWEPGRTFELSGIFDGIPKDAEAARVLEEFAGLVIGDAGPGVDFEKQIVDLQASNWDVFENGFFDDQCIPVNYLTLPLIKVGWIEESNSPVLVDYFGAAYVDGDLPCGSGCYKYPQGISRLLEHLLLGINLEGEIWSYGMNGEILVQGDL